MEFAEEKVPKAADNEEMLVSIASSLEGNIVPETLTIDAVIFALEVMTSVSPTFRPFFTLK